jgi:hypothetical protein
MKVDLQSFGILCTAVLIAETPQLPLLPRIWAHKRGRYCQDRRHLFVTPCDILKGLGHKMTIS